MLRHRPTNTLILSDLLYKSSQSVNGPGGKQNAYTKPGWFATGQEEQLCILCISVALDHAWGTPLNVSKWSVNSSPAAGKDWPALRRLSGGFRVVPFVKLLGVVLGFECTPGALPAKNMSTFRN